MSISSLAPEEPRATAEVHGELGPAYRDAVVDSFLDKVGREIDARVDARLTRDQPAVRQRAAGDHSFALAIMSLLAGIPITAIVVAVGHSKFGRGRIRRPAAGLGRYHRHQRGLRAAQPAAFRRRPLT